MKKLVFIPALILSLGLFAACGRDGNDGTPDGGGGGNGDGGGSNTDDTVFDVQNESMPVGTSVTLEGVVVVAIDAFGGRTGGIYVQEPEGGPFSGVFVFLSGTQAAGLVPGDLVDIEGGEKDEFALTDDTSGRTLTEVSAPQGGSITLTKVGTGTVPTPPVLNPWDLAADDAEAEKWEGVTITFNNVAVTRAPRGVSSSDLTLKEMTVTGPFRVGSNLTDLPDTIMLNDCFASVTGIGDYFFEYKILPRSAADLATGGTSCLPQEEGDTDCADMMDNDYDGFADCADFSCQDTAAACVTDGTVVNVQNGTIVDGSVVQLTDVVVTALDKARKHLFVQDAGAAAVNNGVYVYRGASAMALPAEVVVGAVVDVSGTVDEFDLGVQVNSLTEIVNATVTFKSAGTPPAALTGIPAATLGDITAGEPYEGVLVELSNVKVVNPDAMFGKFTVGATGMELYVDDNNFAYTLPAAATCFATLRGVMTVNVSDDHRALLPRDANDMVTGGTCP